MKSFIMKKITTTLFVLFILISGCQKANDSVQNKSAALPENNTPAAKPAALFNINSPVGKGWVIEGSPLVFDNKSTNADTYYWDFGNGTHSTDKIPFDISFSPCGGTYTITLTVKSKSGDTAVYSETVNVLCNGKHPNSGG